MPRRTLMKMQLAVKAALAGLVLAVAAAVGWALWARSGTGPVPAVSAPPAVAVEAAAVAVGEVVITAEAVGTLLADESVMIRPEIAGRVARIHFQEGQLIERGTTLVTLDAAELAAQLEQSAAAAELARLHHRRMQELVGKRLVSQQVFDEAEARLVEAQARQRLDQARLAKTVLRAPFAGRLGVRRVSPGEFVAVGQDLVNLESIDPVKVELRLPERYAATLRTGQAVELRVDALAGKAFDGTIYAIDPRLDVGTRSLLARARVPNPRSELRPGMFARVTVVLARRAQALLVPEQALMPSGTEQFVFRIIDGRAHMTRVEIGERRAGEVEIRSGLAAGDTVITAGHQRIRDGVPVSVRAPTQPLGAGPGA